MREQAVVTHGYAEARDQVKRHADDQSRPRESERGQHDTHLDDAPPDNVRPIQSGIRGAPPGFRKGLCAHKEFLHFYLLILLSIVTMTCFWRTGGFLGPGILANRMPATSGLGSSSAQRQWAKEQ